MTHSRGQYPSTMPHGGSLMGMFENWRAALLARLGDREDLGKEELYARYWPDLLKEEVFKAFDLIEQEYEVPIGVFRPEDELSKLFEPVASKNPLRWMSYQLMAGDKAFEIEGEMARKLRKYDTEEEWERRTIRTFNDYVRAWCGRKPK